ncbi:MAG: hypothetical protein V1773_12105 [bacterium]
MRNFMSHLSVLSNNIKKIKSMISKNNINKFGAYLIWKSVIFCKRKAVEYLVENNTVNTAFLNYYNICIT